MWQTLLMWGLIVAAIFAVGFVGLVVIAVCVYFGAGPVIRLFTATAAKTLEWIPALIPDATKARADLDAHAITDESASPAHREAIAASRASDRAYDAAFKAARRKQKAGK